VKEEVDQKKGVVKSQPKKRWRRRRNEISYIRADDDGVEADEQKQGRVRRCVRQCSSSDSTENSSKGRYILSSSAISRM
jgi:hypothetical protein